MFKRIAIFMVLILVFILTACGGGGQTAGVENSNNKTNTNEQQASSDTKAEETFVDFVGDQPARFSGSKNKEFKLTMQEGGYLFVMKTKDNVKGLSNLEAISKDSTSGMPLYNSAAAGKDASGWYTFERIEHWYGDGDYTFKVETGGPYSIEIFKLPLASKEIELPLSINGSGARVVGPFSADGAINAKMKSVDAKQAGFTVDLVNAKTGDHANNIYLNIDLQASKVINEFDVTQNVAITESGSYFLSINANSGCEWEIEISK